MPENHTTKDVINLLMEIKVEQAAAGAKQEAMHEDVCGINSRLDTQNGRIGVVEKKLWVIWGGILVAVGVAKLLIG